MRLLSVLVVACSSVSGIFGSGEDNSTLTVSEPEAVRQVSAVELETGSSNVSVAAESTQPFATSHSYPRGPRVARRRGRKWRGFYNDFRYRNPANNPYNPSSPYAFRGRPGQPPVQPAAQPQPPAQPAGYYSDPRYAQYYDPYGQQQYYGYQQGYPQPQPQPQGYYQYPYPHQPQQQPPPPTQPPTEEVPELYYVERPSSPDGHYHYKKVSVVQDFGDGRGRRRRATRWPQYPQQSVNYPQPPQGYYNYPYNPYDRRPPPPQYYQPYLYPQQHYQYSYPKPPGGVVRSRLRTGRPPVRSTMMPGSWRLTFAPVGAFDTTQPAEEPAPPTPQPTEASGD